MVTCSQFSCSVSAEQMQAVHGVCSNYASGVDEGPARAHSQELLMPRGFFSADLFTERFSRLEHCFTLPIPEKGWVGAAEKLREGRD